MGRPQSVLAKSGGFVNNPVKVMKAVFLTLVMIAVSVRAADPASTAAAAVNALGLELLPKVGRSNENVLLSPYSIQNALAMTYAGSDGATRAEMARVLHFPDDEVEVNRSFASLRQTLDKLAARSAKRAEGLKQHGTTNDPITLVTANRLFGQSGLEFLAPFLEVLKVSYGSPLEPLDFKRDAEEATKSINTWVAEQTRQRILDLIPAGALNALTRLVLVNAVYMKAPWQHDFPASGTEPRPFHLNGDQTAEVPTMQRKANFGYAKRDGFIALALPYSDSDLQFLILLPDTADGLAALESRLTPELLVECARLRGTEVVLHLPRFKLEPPTIPLTGAMAALGMKSAFDRPPGSANFGRMVRTSEGGLAISDIFHKTFLAVDEKGTEAAAATAVLMVVTSAPLGQPIEVAVDHPFLFAIQHRPSGACLFLGRLTDPRPVR